MTVDAVVYFRVSDPLIAINNAINYEWATRLLAKTTLRNVLGAHSLAEILSEKDAIAGQMRVSPTLSVCSVHWEGLRRQPREHLRGWPREVGYECCVLCWSSLLQSHCVLQVFAVNTVSQRQFL